jgi:hypothetical protein
MNFLFSKCKSVAIKSYKQNSFKYNFAFEHACAYRTVLFDFITWRLYCDSKDLYDKKALEQTFIDGEIITVQKLEPKRTH